jgi:type I restriction-modification system DNA methylase subunit
MKAVPRDLVKNRNLFSNHFFETILPGLDEWSLNEHEAAFVEFKKRYEAERPFLENLKESQLEERFFRPLLRILGFTAEVQEGIDQALEYPDYALFESRTELDRAHRGTDAFYNRALAIAEVKRWDAPLDRFGRDRHDKRRNPSYQIWHYLRLTKPRWGILTNGSRWRLYYEDRPMDSFYEVDLAQILEQEDVEAFRYFYYFFRKEAFLPRLETKPFVDRVLEGSEDYAREVGESLKENVYQALLILAQGFFDLRENNLEVRNEEHLVLVHKYVMRLLYRLLFIFYAEGKELIGGSDYLESSYSLYRLKHEVAQKRDRGDLILSAAKGYWSRLLELFSLLDKGSVDFGVPEDQFHVPAYNGGLFDPQINDFLETKAVGDAYVARAVDLLARAPTNGGPLGFVDYSTLDIRHLGSIYEGLLEYRLQVVPEKMVAVGKKLVWTPYEECRKNRSKAKSFESLSEEDIAEAGELILVTDSGERKATGSYYTPDYIVKYVIERTLEPIVKRKWQEAKDAETPISEAILSIRVLDPAMGSGHFLVGAVEYLAGKLLEAVSVDVEEGYVSEEEAARWTPDLAKREVASRCIYGVDLNELAVELAKVSLWLATVSRDMPLSFLDHHLKWGNSLIGSQLVDLGWLPGKRPEGALGPIQIPFGHVEKILSRIRELDEIKEETADDVKRKEDLFQRLQKSDEYRRIKLLADVHTGLRFGDFDWEKIRPGYMELAAEAYFGDPKKWERKFGVSWARDALAEARARHSFHWELEFPNAFFPGDPSEGEFGRFDAVIGNPPYLKIQILKKADPAQVEYFRQEFESAGGNYDIYVLFLELGIQRLAHSLGFIVTRKFTQGSYGRGFRRLIARKGLLAQLLSFSNNQVFEDAYVNTCLIFLDEAARDAFNFIEIPKLSGQIQLEDVVTRLRLGEVPEIVVKRQVSLGRLSDGVWSFRGGEEDHQVKRKALKGAVCLGECSRIFVGLQTSADPVYLLERVSENGDTVEVLSKQTGERYSIERGAVKPVLKGDEIWRYYHDEFTHWLLFPYSVEDGEAGPIARETLESRWPKAWKYLMENKSRLLARANVNDEKWWVYTYPKNLASFEQPKILTQVLASRASMCLDKEGRFYVVGGGNAGGYCIVPTTDEIDLGFLLGLLNSTFTDWYIKKIVGSQMESGNYSFAKRYIEQLPVILPSSSGSDGDASELLEACRGFVSEFLKGGDLTDLHEFLRSKVNGSAAKQAVLHEAISLLATSQAETMRAFQSEVRSFVRWLETFAGISIAEWSRKTAALKYHEGRFGDLLEAFKENQAKMKVHPHRRYEDLEALKDGYEASVARLIPLKSRSDSLDVAIDLLVYALYDLTLEEIATVEGLNVEEARLRFEWPES